MEMCLMWLVSLPLLAIKISDLISNIMGVDCSGTASGSLLNNSLFRILKFARDIPALHYALYFISELDLRNRTWNMCEIINWSTLIKHNICSCSSASIWTVPQYLRTYPPLDFCTVIVHEIILKKSIGPTKSISDKKA